MNKEFRQELKEYRDLLVRISIAGIPPHADYWHQSLDDAEKKIFDAANKVIADKIHHEVEHAKCNNLMLTARLGESVGRVAVPADRLCNILSAPRNP